MKKLVVFILVVACLISTAMWLDYNMASVFLIPTLGFKIPSRIILLWVGILIAIGCIFIASMPNDKENQKDDTERMAKLERGRLIMERHQQDVASGKKRHWTHVTLSK